MSWPICQISAVQTPAIMILDYKCKRIATVYFLVFVQGNCTLLGKRSNCGHLDRHLFVLLVLRDIISHQAGLFTDKVILASNKTGSLQQGLNIRSVRALLLPVSQDIISLLPAGYQIQRHNLTQKDLYLRFMELAPSPTIMLGLDSFVPL